jgi:hypothetical protein
MEESEIYVQYIVNKISPMIRVKKRLAEPKIGN